MRADDEIVNEAREFLKFDMFGAGTADLIECLPFELAKEFAREGFTEADWEQLPRDFDSVLARLKDYMPFAWEKANDCRGLSAGRSLFHMQAWLFLLGPEFDELRESLTHYTHYGKPQLVAICERFGIDWRDLDDGDWRNNECEEGVSADYVLGAAGGSGKE